MFNIIFTKDWIQTADLLSLEANALPSTALNKTYLLWSSWNNWDKMSEVAALPTVTEPLPVRPDLAKF